MNIRKTAPLIGVFFAASVLLYACSPSSVNKSDMSTDAMTPSATVQAAEGTRQVSGQGDYNTSSSLDALRRGESPSSGPLKAIYFDFDSYGLRPEARETLKANATWLKANPAARVEVEGHCDERGTNEYNLALGAKRANAARDYLVTLGVTADRIKTVSYGEEIPVCKESSEGCWQQNRHARFAVGTSGPVS